MPFQKGNIPWNIGIPQTEECKEKSSLAHLGKHHTEEAKLKMSKTRKGQRFSEEHKLKIGLAQLGEKNHNYGKKASNELRQKLSLAMMGKRVGEKHPMFGNHSFCGEKSSQWQGGITPEHIRIRNGVEYNTWRLAVFERDNFTCQKCGSKKGGSFNAHHIKSFSKHPELRFEVSNGITYCEDCHFHNGFHKWEFLAKF